METTLNRLRAVFVRQLELPADFDAGSVQLYETPRWDSLGHMSLVVGLEDEFDVELTTDQVIEMRNFDEVVGALRALGVDV